MFSGSLVLPACCLMAVRTRSMLTRPSSSMAASNNNSHTQFAKGLRVGLLTRLSLASAANDLCTLLELIQEHGHDLRVCLLVRHVLQQQLEGICLQCALQPSI